MMLIHYIFVSTLATTLLFGSSIGTNFKSLVAKLKPLTPIAGTNLFCNLVYKWHDRLKPGCFCTFFTEKYADWSDKLPGVSFVCNKADQKYYDTADAEWVFQRTDGEESTEEYSGTLKVRNVGAEKTMETWKSAGTWWVGLGSYAARPHEDMWYIRSQPNNKSNVNLVVDEYWWLAQNPTSNYRTWVYLQEKKPGKYEHKFVPSIKINAKMYQFEFKKPTKDELLKHTSQKGLIDTYEIENFSPSTVSREVRVSEKVTSSFSWSFSESMKHCSSISASVGVPGLAESSVEAGFELELSANQNWVSTKEKTFEMSYNAEVPPDTKISISAWYDLIENIEMPYTAKVEMTGKTSRFTMYDDRVDDAKATGAMIETQLRSTQFDGVILEVKRHMVIVQIKGIMKASLGVNGQLNVNGENAETQK